MHVLAALGSRSAVVSFLETNSEADTRDSDGNTPLMLTIREGHQNTALALLNWLADVEYLQKKNEQIDNQHRSIVCVANPCLDVNTKNKDGDTMLNVALDQKAGEVILKLIKAGADLEYMERETELVHHTISSRNTTLHQIYREKYQFGRSCVLCIEKSFASAGLYS